MNTEQNRRRPSLWRRVTGIIESKAILEWPFMWFFLFIFKLASDYPTVFEFLQTLPGPNIWELESAASQLHDEILEYYERTYDIPSYITEELTIQDILELKNKDKTLAALSDEFQIKMDHLINYFANAALVVDSEP